jgi:hypothetical protein
MDNYEAEIGYARWVEDEAYNTEIIPEYMAAVDAEAGVEA